MSKDIERHEHKYIDTRSKSGKRYCKECLQAEPPRIGRNMVEIGPAPERPKKEAL